MATTDELLTAAEDEGEDVIDYFVIDAEGRTITVPSSEAVFGVYSDNTVERKYFMCPRYVVSEKMDMLGSTVKVNYVSSGGNIGSYKCEDVAEYGDDYVTFSWVLSKDLFDGNKNTTVSFAVSATDGTNAFNTRKASGNVYETIEAETLYSKYASLLLQIVAMIGTEIDATNDDAIIAGIQEIIDKAAATTGSEETDIAGQIEALIEGYGRGETVSVVDVSQVEVYIADFYSDTVETEAGVVDVYKRVLVS